MPLNKTGTLIGGISGLAAGTAQWLYGGRNGNKSFYNVERFNSELEKGYGLFKPTLFFVDIATPKWVNEFRGLAANGDPGDRSTAPGYDGKGLDESADPASAWVEDSSRRMQFLCSSANLPGVQILTSDHRRQGFGTFDRRPFGVQVTDIPLTFMLDNRGWILKFFNQWANAIVNYEIRNGEHGEAKLGHSLFEIGYREDYETKITITTLTGTQDPGQEPGTGNDQTDRGLSDSLEGVGVKIVQYELHEAFPIQIGDTSVAWNAENQFATLPVQFTFRSYNIRQLPTGKMTTARGFSMAEWIGILGSAANLGSQIFSNPPNSIGSAINLFTNTKLFYNIANRVF